MGILSHVNKQIPVVAICGQIAGDITSLKQQGLTEAIAIYPSHDAFIQRKNDPKDDFETFFEAWVKQKIRGV
jgi:glycerate kinase